MPVNLYYTQRIRGFQQESVKYNASGVRYSLKRTRFQCRRAASARLRRRTTPAGFGSLFCADGTKKAMLFCIAESSFCSPFFIKIKKWLRQLDCRRAAPARLRRRTTPAGVWFSFLC